MNTLDKMPPKILVLESDEVTRASLSNTLERYWFNALRVGDLETAIKTMNNDNPNIVVLSSKFNQDKSPSEVALMLRQLPGFHDLPITFLIDTKEDISKYSVSENELNEFITRPFTPNELMIAVKNLLRKSKPSFDNKILKYKDIVINLATYKITKGTRKISTGPTEFKILNFLMKSPKTIFTREQIVEYVWGTDREIDPRTVDVHINRLRAALKGKDSDSHVIKTVRAAGYCLSLPGEID
jgi:two-component system phosphate regulon response regulator PhoB